MSIDAKADGQFQPVHRAGYQHDKLEWLMQWLALHPDATLASGEGRVLLDEINRVREVAQANYRNMERLGVEVKRLRTLIDAVDVDRMTERARQPEIDALQARVRELESTVLNEHSRLAQEEAKPAAVGVVGGRMKRWDYHCEAGSYYCDTLLGLLREIVTHRFWHWRRGDGWVD
jgi:polyhydroxyalkanoate synthesis regulator phasin